MSLKGAALGAVILLHVALSRMLLHCINPSDVLGDTDSVSMSKAELEAEVESLTHSQPPEEPISRITTLLFLQLMPLGEAHRVQLLQPIT